MSASPGLSWGGRRRRLADEKDDDDDEEEEIQDMRSFAEQIALNNTLDKMQLVINVQKKYGMITENETNQIVVDDLKEYLKTNSHGKKEIKLDSSDMIISGSDEHPQMMDVIFTQYSLRVNYNKLYEQAFDMCMGNGNCYDSFEDENGLQTKMYQIIHANSTATFDEIKDHHDTLENATKNETSKDKLYEMYHEFFTKMKSETKEID